MHRTFFTLIFVTALLSSSVNAQGPGGRGGRGPGGGEGVNVQESVERLMNFDKNKDGKLTSDELSDTRLASLLERADANKDKAVTREELTQLLTRESQGRQGGEEGRGPGGEGRGREFGGGRGGDFGGGRGGEFGRGRGPMMRPGQIMPEFMLEQLQPSEEQRNLLAKLQAHVDAELAKILTASQRETLQQMSQGPRGERAPAEGPEGGPEFRRGPGGEGRGDRPRAEGRP